MPGRWCRDLGDIQNLVDHPRLVFLDEDDERGVTINPGYAAVFKRANILAGAIMIWEFVGKGVAAASASSVIRNRSGSCP